MKKEYRGQRSVDALVQFAKDEAKPSSNDIQSLDQLNSLDVSVFYLNCSRWKILGGMVPCDFFFAVPIIAYGG